MPSGRKVRSNKGKKRGSYRTRKTHHAIKVRVNSKGNRRVSRRKLEVIKEKENSIWSKNWKDSFRKKI